MNATNVISIAPAEWAWLACEDPACTWTGPVNRPDKLEHHTRGVHARRPSIVERTPVVPPSRLPALATDSDLLDHVLRDGGRRLVDHDDDRVWWCAFGEHYGITRLDGVWWYARREPLRPLAPIHTPSTIAALDRWELDTIPADTDPTPAFLPRYIALAGGGS